MAGENDVSKLLQGMSPKLNKGSYVFTTVAATSENIDSNDTICQFKEEEGITVIMKKERADALGLSYDYVAAWITLSVHSSLHAIGLTAAFSSALSKNGISCNVISGYYHDHIFVPENESEAAMKVLRKISDN
ncbi:ACT domain-containing protein [Maribacter sp. 2-571]|uniref:ACT domain-containing protein n=1 Tax=Maribacter sp. 2-571 TaxID=3417569 RepID=UPI003D35042F